LLLLAILTGYPSEATEILWVLVEQEHGETWWEFIRGFEKWTKPALPHNEPGNQSGAVSPVKEAIPAYSDVGQAGSATLGAGTASQNNNEDQVSQESKAKAATAERSNGAQPDRVTEGEARRWRELLDKLEEMREGRLIPEECSCRDFVEWAPRIARYSFQSGRVLLARRPRRL
jgi:hypothetical protein